MLKPIFLRRAIGQLGPYFLPLLSVSSAWAQNPFITTWKTDNPGVSNSTSIIIPVFPGRSDYNYDVDWNNDGVFDEFGITGAVTHDFGAPGTYTIQIRGSFPHIYHYYLVNHDAQKLVEINQWGDIQWKNMYQAFAGCKNMTLMATDAPDLSQVTELGFMFDGCEKLNTNIEHWDVSTITNFSFVFRNCKLYNQPLNNWNVTNALAFTHMFDNCLVFNQPLNNWNVSKSTSFSAMFMGCPVFNQDIGGWDVGNATLFDQMFSGASIFNQDITGWNVSKGTKFTSMFAQTKVFNQDISDWNMSNATHLNAMFLGARGFNRPLIKWDVSKVMTMSLMFSQSIFNEDISTWNTQSVLTTSNMFWNNTVFNQPIGNWNLASDTTMAEMFRGATAFNQDISSWNTSNVKNMSGMFLSANSFNQDIGNWNVAKVKDFSGMFNQALSFNQDISNWKTTSATDMNTMFNQNPVFNQDISGWDVDQVKDMTSMFRYATSFNQDIGKWNTASLTSMETILLNATSFDYDLATWNISQVNSMLDALDNCGMSLDNYDNTLRGWDAAATKQTGLTVGAQNLIYCSGSVARANLITNSGWTFDGDSKDCSYTPTGFITTWITDNPGTSNSTSISIPTSGGGYNYDVDWNNDGEYDEFGITGDVTHDYGVAGTYTIRIRGTFPWIRFEHIGDAEKIIDVVQWGNIQWKNMFESFDGCKNLNISATDAPDLSNVTRMGGMFLNCLNLNANINHWDVSHVTEMSGCFFNAKIFNSPLNNWKVNNVTTFTLMFNGASAFNQPLDNWNTGSAIDMNRMFSYATSFNQDIGNWNVSKVTNMSQMFRSAESFNQNIGGWVVSSVTNMSEMFNHALVFNQDLNSWNTGKVTTMNAMFASAAQFNGNITSWNVSEVVSFDAMFLSASVFNQDIGNWTPLKAQTMTSMFRSATAFNQDLGNWNTSSVQNMESMFEYAINFDQDLGGWQVGNVVNMRKTFANTSIDQDFGAWDVRQVADMTQMFRGVTLSTPNYDNLLIEWAKQALQSNVPFDAGFSKYCLGAAARQSMIDTFNWTISDGGTSDVTAPTVVCKDISVALDATGNATITANMLDGGSTDDCSSTADLTFAASQTSFDCSDIGDVSVTFTVTDNVGNSANCTATVTVTPAPLTLSNCPSNITVSVSEASCQSVATWTPPVVSCGNILTSTHNSGDKFLLGTTVVTYTASDGLGNTLQCSFNVKVTNNIAINVSTASNASCFDASDGQFLVTITSGASPFTFDWDYDGVGDFDDLQDQNNLGVGNHMVTVRDGNGCEFSIPVTMGYDPLMFTSCPDDIVIPPIAAGCQAIASWALPTYSCGAATLTSTHNSGDLFSMGTTTVTYTLESSNGESISCSFDITVASDLSLIATTQSPLCPGDNTGQIFLSATQGMSPYVFDWNTDGVGDFDDAQDQSGLSAATYAVVVRDAQGCEKSIDVLLPDANPMQLTAAVIPSSGISTLDLTISGGTSPYVYDWLLNETESLGDMEDIILKQPGVYTVQVTDDNGCEQTTTFSIDPDGLLCESADFIIYPNPSDGEFVLLLSDCVNEAKIEIYSMLGQLITSGITSTLYNEIKLDLANEQYILRVSVGNKRKTLLIEVMK